MTLYRYYSDRLAAERLERAYQVAPPRVRQYLEAEIEHVTQKIRPDDTVLELGCGYGRAVERLAAGAGMVVGIDTSLASLCLGKNRGPAKGGHLWACMDAGRLGLRDHTFDCSVCIQNGISAFHIDPVTLIAESIRVTKQGGTVLFSTYSEKFWPDRLIWFERQAEAGLLGEIDYEKTGNGNIVCKDGFTARTVTPDEFGGLTSHLDADTSIVEVDDSSIFCEIVVGS
jgi:2-polyprenyl-6-hydroxyphenyl methylase/3-demethylubiquinone-9 3-methyltransferase